MFQSASTPFSNRHDLDKAPTFLKDFFKISSFYMPIALKRLLKTEIDFI